MDKNLLSYKNNACLGCGQIIAARTVINTLGPKTIIVNATGCLEITTTQYPDSAWGVPWIHSLFENAASVASGILAGLRAKKDTKTKVVIQAGDGSTFDIGFSAILGMWERKEDIIYICYDNEIYANTGMQASGATQQGTHTSTTPSGIKSQGKNQEKKDMIEIAVQSGLNYVAQTTAGFLDDITEKINKAKATKGPSYIQILSPCMPGWKIKANEGHRLGQLAAHTGLYPSVEYTNGKLTKVIKIPRPKIKVEEYLKPQLRFKHLFATTQGKKELELIQKIADKNIKKYNL